MNFELEHGVAVLSRTPRVADGLLRGLPDAWVRGTEGGDTWSAYDVVGHLIHGERTDWIPRARMILEQGQSRAFEPFDRSAQFRESAGKPLEELLGEFASARAASLATLGGWNLTPAQLELRGRHPDLGVVTLGQLLATWVVHDLDHISQIVRAMASQYSGAVGPWKTYLRIVREPV